MPPSKTTLLHRWFDEVWNEGREEVIEEMMADGCPVHGVIDEEGKEICGQSAFKAFFRKMRSAFPDLRIKVEDVISQDNRIAARCTVTGTHRGHGLGIPPTGKPINLTGMAMIHWKDGKCYEAWNNFDFHLMKEQLK